MGVYVYKCLYIRLHCKKKRIFTKLKKDLHLDTRSDPFIGSAKKRFRTELLPDAQQHWFRTQGSVRNLYQKKVKRFRTMSFVLNHFRILIKRFRNHGSVLNLLRQIEKRFRSKGFVLNLSHELKKRFRMCSFSLNLFCHRPNN